MEIRSTRVAVIGTGMVGSTYAFALLASGLVDEMVLIDANVDKAQGDAMDLNHGMAFGVPVRVWQGGYEDCAQADIVVISAGASQGAGESRLSLIGKNTEIFQDIVGKVMASGFRGVIVVATNPVDVLSHVTWKASGLPPNRVIGSGTIIDTARFRFLLGQYFSVDPRNVHAYIIGEHGDTEVPVWSGATIGERCVTDLVGEKEGLSRRALDDIFTQVRDAGYRIIEKKGATYYAIALGLVRITEALVRNENSILTVSTLLRGEYGTSDIFIGVPAVVNRNGIREVVQLDLNDEERAGFAHSAETLREAMAQPAGV